MKRAVIATSLLCLSAFCNAAHADQLHNNGPVVNASGLSILPTGSTTLGFNARTFSVADDFTIANGARWNISSIDFFGYQTGSSNFTFTNATWSIVSGDVSNGTVVASGTTAVTNGGLVGYRVTPSTQSASNRGIYRIQADITDVTLGEGSYWLRWSLAGSLASGPWVPPTADHIAGNAHQGTVGGIFNQLADGASGNTAELPFALHGTVAPVPEPETWAMMLGGLALLGAAARRRKQA